MLDWLVDDEDAADDAEAELKAGGEELDWVDGQEDDHGGTIGVEGHVPSGENAGEAKACGHDRGAEQGGVGLGDEHVGGEDEEGDDTGGSLGERDESAEEIDEAKEDSEVGSGDGEIVGGAGFGHGAV